MSFEIKFKMLITFIISFLILISALTMYMIIDINIVHGEMNDLREKNILLIQHNYDTINETLESLKSINNYLDNPELPETLTLLNRMNNFIDTNDDNELNQAIAITKATPLDLYTSSIIVGYSRQFDIPISIILALIEQESNFNQFAVGAHMDRGYCQIIPDTEKWLANNFGHILGIEYDKNRIYEPEYNIGLGVLYLYNLKNAHGEDYHKILSEYNRGVYNLQRYYDAHGTYVTTYSRGILSREAKYKDFN